MLGPTNSRRAGDFRRIPTVRLTRYHLFLLGGLFLIFMGPLASPPAKTNPIWGGHDDGGIYQCLVPGSDVNGDRVLLFWAAGTPPAAPPPPDPEVLARQAMNAMQLKAVNIGIVPESRPGSIGIIGLPTWMWVEGAAENTWGPITRTASCRVSTPAN